VLHLLELGAGLLDPCLRLTEIQVLLNSDPRAGIGPRKGISDERVFGIGPLRNGHALGDAELRPDLWIKVGLRNIDEGLSGLDSRLGLPHLRPIFKSQFDVIIERVGMNRKVEGTQFTVNWDDGRFVRNEELAPQGRARRRLPLLQLGHAPTHLLLRQAHLEAVGLVYVLVSLLQEPVDLFFCPFDGVLRLIGQAIEGLREKKLIVRLPGPNRYLRGFYVEARLFDFDPVTRRLNVSGEFSPGKQRLLKRNLEPIKGAQLSEGKVVLHVRIKVQLIVRGPRRHALDSRRDRVGRVQRHVRQKSARPGLVVSSLRKLALGLASVHLRTRPQGRRDGFREADLKRIRCWCLGRGGTHKKNQNPNEVDGAHDSRASSMESSEMRKRIRLVFVRPLLPLDLGRIRRRRPQEGNGRGLGLRRHTSRPARYSNPGFPHVFSPLMSSSNSPRRLGDVLEEVIDQLGVQNEIDEARVVETWASLVGAKVNSVTESAWMKGTTLYVKITSAAWRQELHMNRRKWRNRLNEALDADLVDEIVFR